MPSMALSAEVTEAEQWPQRIPLIWIVGMGELLWVVFAVEVDKEFY
jgi:hypothetical protein